MAKKRVTRKQAVVKTATVDPNTELAQASVIEKDEVNPNTSQGAIDSDAANNTFELTENESSQVSTANQTNVHGGVSENSPSRLDPGWTDHVLGMLAPKEKHDGHPKSDGLRRLVEVLIGPIISMKTEMKSNPVHGADNHVSNTATAISTMVVIDRQYNEKIECSAVADASCYSCKAPYDKFLSSIAETRAEGRVYRKVLRLINVVTSDEIKDIPQQELPDRISVNQISVISRMCETLNINVQKVMHLATKQKKTNIKQYMKDDARVVLEKLHDVQNKGKAVPDVIKGYESDWKEFFGQ